MVPLSPPIIPASFPDDIWWKDYLMAIAHHDGDVYCGCHCIDKPKHKQISDCTNTRQYLYRVERRLHS